MLSPRTYPKKERGIAVFGGNTRLEIARELGYTHIDCVTLQWGDEKIKDKMPEMYRFQELQRGEFLEFYPTERMVKAGWIVTEAGEKRWLRVKPRGTSCGIYEK